MSEEEDRKRDMVEALSAIGLTFLILGIICFILITFGA